MGAPGRSGSPAPRAAELSPPAFPRRGHRAMLASRVVRGSWGALRGVTWEPGARPGKGRARGALLPPVPSCLAGRWWLRPAALGLRLPGVGPRGHCSGAEKAAPRSAPGEDAAAEARGGPASAASLVGNRGGGGGGATLGRGRRPCGGLVLDESNALGPLRVGRFRLRTFKPFPGEKLRAGYSVGMNLRGTERVHLPSRRSS